MTVPPLFSFLTRLVIALLFAYVLFCGLLYMLQERLIFFPIQDPPGTRYDFGLPVDELFIPVAGAKLHALHFQIEAPRGVILYLHGNAGSLRSWGAVAPDFVRRGYDVLIVDYRGYGQSSGSISSEAQLHQDMAAIYDVVRAQYPEEQIVLYGRSLGSGLATRLAAEHAPQQLILESPFYSLEIIARRQFAFVPSFLLKYPLRTHQWIGQVRCPITIVHGTADTVVPFADGERLRQHSNAPLQFHAIPGGGHNDLELFPEYHAALDAALAQAE